MMAAMTMHMIKTAMGWNRKVKDVQITPADGTK